MTDTTKPLAQRYFAAYGPWHSLRNRIDELVDNIYRTDDGANWCDIRLDYYDESIEIWGVTPTAEADARLRAAGFVRIWQHPHEDRQDCRCPPRFA